MALAEFAAVSSALGALKTITSIAKNVNSIELNDKIIELQQSILDMQTGMTGLADENRALKHEIEEVNRLGDISDDMEYVEDGGFYIRKSEKAAGKTIPYCPACWKVDKSDVPLNPQGGRGVFRCNVHHTTHETQAHREYVKRAFGSGGIRGG